VRQGAVTAVLVLLAGCTDDGQRASTTSATPNVDQVSLVEVGEGLAEECAQAAEFLAMSVPCPMKLPVIAGEAPSCHQSPPQGADPSPPCVAQAGGDETLDTIFSLSVQDSEASNPAAHLVVEARRVEKAPPLPCYKGTESPSIKTGPRTLRVLRCAEKDEGADAVVRHGEGAHYGHLLGYWDEAGVRYVVSVHDQGRRGRDLLMAVTSEIALIGP
jgi:hypothetical protein